MSTPTRKELDCALHQAARLRESGEDYYFLGKALLNTHYRLEKLEQLLALVESYVSFGQDEQNHARLIKAIDEYRALSARTAKQETTSFGL